MIDYLILAPLDLEIDSLLQAFDSIGSQPNALRDGSSYFKVQSHNHSGECADLRIVQLKGAGILQAALTACLLIEEWRPACVVSFGIAGGLGDTPLEDVVVAESVFYYEPAKETSLRSKRRVDANHSSADRGHLGESESTQTRHARLVTYQCDFGLVAKCRNLWSKYPHTVDWKVHFGPIASGEKLLADNKSPTREAILDLHDKMLAVEMEAAGVAAADKEVSIGRPRRFIAIKGISDNASRGKGAQNPHRVPAAKHAAEFCRLMVESQPIEDDFQRLDEIDIEGIHTRATAICSYLNPLLETGHSVSQDQVSSLLSDGKPVPIFYHWTAENRPMHWVDFRFLLVLQHLKELGLAPRILISDFKEDFTPKDRSPIEEIVRSVLGEGTPIYWYEDVKRKSARYARYADSRGLSRDYLERIFSDTEERLLKDFWMMFIGWEVRWGNRCLLLQWHRQAETAARLSQMVVLRSVVLPTPDIRLGHGLGKWEAPGATLFIKPPLYASILDWLESDPDPSLIQQLVDLLSVNQVTTVTKPSDFDRLLNGRVSLKTKLASSVESPTPTQLLVWKLAQWNVAFSWMAT